MLSLKDSLLHCQTGAGQLRSLKHGHLRIFGPDSAAFLHRMTSNDVLGLPVGSNQPNALLDRKGMVLSLFQVIRLASDQFYLVTAPVLIHKTREILEKSRFRDQVVIEDISDTSALLTLAGAQAAEVPSDKDFMGYRESWLTTPVVNIWGPQEKILPLAEHLSPEVPLLDPQTLRLIQIKSGYPEYGVDIDETHILLETPVPIAHKRNKGCYPGQEVIERISSYGQGRTPRTLCVLKTPGRPELSAGLKIFFNKTQEAGFVTSFQYDPCEEATYLLAYLDHPFIKESSDLSTDFCKCNLISPIFN